MADTVLVMTRKLPAPLSEVYRAWTDPQVMSQWYAPGAMTVGEVVADTVTGGDFRVVMQEENGKNHIATGKYIEVVPEQKLVHSLQWEGSELNTQVTLEFKAIDKENTELTLTHELFPNAEVRDSHGQGWTGCLANLDNYIATQTFA